MKKILQIILITTLALTGFYLPQTAIGVKSPPLAQDIWHLRGINNEANMSILFKNKGQSTSIDMCYDLDGRLYAAWIDTNALGKPVPCYAFFDNNSWKYYSNYGTREKQNGYCYIGFNKFQSELLDWSSVWVRIISTHNMVLAVYVVDTKDYGKRLYFSKLNGIEGINTDCAPVNDVVYEGQEDSPDLARIYDFNNGHYTVYMTYTKIINGVKEVCVAYFDESPSEPQGGKWYSMLGTSNPGYTVVNPSNLSKDNPRIAVNRENPAPLPNHIHPFAICYQANRGANLNNIFFTWWNSYTNTFTGVNYYTSTTELFGGQIIKNRTQPHIAHKGGDEYFIAWVEDYYVNSKKFTAIAITQLKNGAFIKLGTDSPLSTLETGYYMIPSSRVHGMFASAPFLHSTNVMVHQIEPIIAWDQTIKVGSNNTMTKVVFHLPPEESVSPYGRFVSLVNRFDPMEFFPIIQNFPEPYKQHYKELSNCRIVCGTGNDNNKPIIFGVCQGKDGYDNYFAKLSYHQANTDPPLQSCVYASAKIKGIPASRWQDWQSVNESSVVELLLYTQGLDDAIIKGQVQATNFLYACFDPPLYYKKESVESIPLSLMYKQDLSTPWQDITTLSNNQKIKYLRVDPSELKYEEPRFLLMSFFTKDSPSQHPGVAEEVLPLHFYNYFFIDEPDSTAASLPFNFPTPDHLISTPIRHRAFVGFNNSTFDDFVAVGDMNLYVDRGWYTTTNLLINNPYEDYPNFIYSLILENPEELTGLTFEMNPFEGMFDEKGEALSFLTITAAKDAPLITQVAQFSCKIYSNPTKMIPMATCAFNINIHIRTPDLVGQKSAKKSYAIIGDYVDYTISASNIGDGIAYYVEIVDALPRELVYISSQPNATADGDSLKWTVEKLMPGQTFYIKLRAKVRDDLGLKVGHLIINTARFKSHLNGFSSNVSVTIQPSIPGSTNPQAELVIKNIKKGNIIYAGEAMEGTLKVLSGSGPFTASIMWGDSTKPEEYAIGETNTKNVSHTYDQPGDYTIITTVRDDYGKFTNIYKHIRVISR